MSLVAYRRRIPVDTAVRYLSTTIHFLSTAQIPPYAISQPHTSHCNIPYAIAVPDTHGKRLEPAQNSAVPATDSAHIREDWVGT